MAGLIHFRVGAWQDFGYENPPTPESATVPPLGKRSANAIKAGHEAVEEIDRLIARLHQVRAQLVSELRQDEDIRAARVDAMLAGPFRHGQQVTVTDGGWTGTVERISNEDRTAYVRFPGRPELVPYAFEALR